MTSFAGSCLCGAVAFELDSPTKWCAHCHCSMCRRAHGAPFVTWVGSQAANFRWTRGEDKLKRYASSENATRTFCTECGGMIAFEGTRWPDEIHIARAHIPGPIDRDPSAHVFFSHKVPWVHVDDALKKLGGPTGNEPL